MDGVKQILANGFHTCCSKLEESAEMKPKQVGPNYSADNKAFTNEATVVFSKSDVRVRDKGVKYLKHMN